MKLTFLGTAASPSMPLAFCRCENCRTARRLGGRNLRRRSSALVNDDLLIDLGPDAPGAAFALGLDLADVQLCLQTHFHEDHFDPELLIARHADYGSEGIGVMVLIASPETLARLDELVARRCGYGSIRDEAVQMALRIQCREIAPFGTLVAGGKDDAGTPMAGRKDDAGTPVAGGTDDNSACSRDGSDVSAGMRGYRITAFPASHGAPGDGCLLYAIEQENHAIFYGTDTSILDESVWRHLASMNMRFDAVVLDCTYGYGFSSQFGDHLALSDFRLHARRFRESGLLKEGAEIYATHLSHEGCTAHEAYDADARKNGHRIAWDGLVLSF